MSVQGICGKEQPNVVNFLNYFQGKAHDCAEPSGPRRQLGGWDMRRLLETRLRGDSPDPPDPPDPPHPLDSSDPAGYPEVWEAEMVPSMLLGPKVSPQPGPALRAEKPKSRPCAGKLRAAHGALLQAVSEGNDFKVQEVLQTVEARFESLMEKLKKNSIPGV